MNGTRRTAEFALDVDQLIHLAATGLERLYVPSRLVFCRRARPDRSGLLQYGESRRYTAMTLLGLGMYEGAVRPGGRVEEIASALLADLRWADNIGDLGLALWLCGRLMPNHLESVWGRARPSARFNTCPKSRHGHTMELAWFLTGLTYAANSSATLRREVVDLAKSTSQALCKNQSETGFFGHCCSFGSVSGALRGRVGSFADQVYPIYALSRYATLLGVGDAADRARRAAEGIIRLQGALGQWWWHYDAPSGRIVQRYPVYSVHQDGMAPMALWAVSEATGIDLTEPIYRGLNWIGGVNELDVDLRDQEHSVIWRCIQHRHKFQAVLDIARTIGSATTRADSKFVVLEECRPYHLGWLLYAFSKNR